MEPNETTPAGWAAIDRAMQSLYGTVEPKHFGTLIPYRQGGPDPLDGISAYFNERPAPHWHLVSYGLTELREKESPNAGVSGFGFELTLRLAGGAKIEGPPLWPMGLLQSLARYVFTTGKYFEPGHFFELGEALAPEAPEFTAVAFRRDPQLPVSKSSFGAFEFLQVVPLRSDEVRALRAWNTLGVLEVMAKRDALLIASATRPSVLADGALSSEINERTGRDGSATPRLRLASGGWQKSPWGEEVEVTLTAGDCAQLGAVLRGRIPLGRPLSVFVAEAETALLELVSGDRNAVTVQGRTLRLALTRELSLKVSADLTRGPGPWRWPELSHLVVQTPGAAR